MSKKSLTPGQMRKRKLGRVAIVCAVFCPDCAAARGERCYRSDRGGKRRKSPHIQRVRLYQTTRRHPVSKITYTEENATKVRNVAEALLGTTNSLDPALAKAFSDEELTASDFDIALLQEIDDITMECEACGWWCEAGDLDDDQVCGDCRTEN